MIFNPANDFESCFIMIVWAIDVDDVIHEGCIRLVEEHGHIILLSCYCSLKLPLIA